MIEEYEFGKIRVDGKEYTHDVVIIPGKIIDWWRGEGHHARASDFKDIPDDVDILVIGTGASGVMDVDNDVAEYFRKKNIEIVIKKTADAVKEFNRLIEKNKKAGAALHLTC
jgi:hypothetical protein